MLISSTKNAISPSTALPILSTKEPIILGFDVSNNTCSVAISAGQSILAYNEDFRPSMQAETLLILIEKALKEAGLNYQQLEYLALTNGPGSFTGIRIGLATTEGILVAAKNIKGLAISNFEITFYRLTRQVKNYQQVLILLNAYRDQTYYHFYSYPSIKGDFGLIDNNKIPELIAPYEDQQLICGGNGASNVYHLVSHRSNITFLPRFSHINAVHICRYADIKIQKNELDPVEPLYIRPPDAQIPLRHNLAKL